MLEIWCPQTLPFTSWPCISSWVTLGRLLSFSEPYSFIWRMKARVVRIQAGCRAGLRTRRSKRAS